MNLSLNISSSFFSYPQEFTNSVKLINNNGIFGYEHIGGESTLRVILRGINGLPNLSGWVYLSDIIGNIINDRYNGLTESQHETKYCPIKIPSNSVIVEIDAGSLLESMNLLTGSKVLIDIDGTNNLRLISGDTTVQFSKSHVQQCSDYGIYAHVNLDEFKRVLKRFNPTDKLTLYLKDTGALILSYDCLEYSLLWEVF